MVVKKKKTKRANGGLATFKKYGSVHMTKLAKRKARLDRKKKKHE